jgi:protein-S-isoprenylcysteine O-methyltransferase Ste14
MFAGVWVIFRRIVRRDYEKNGRLTPLSFFLQLLIWGLFFAFPCIYNPIQWAWTQSEISHVMPLLGRTGWACVWIGVSVVVGAMFWLGLPRSFGQKGPRLETSGPYRVTRNPQIMGGALLVIGCILLWPSWYMMGWLALFATMAHLMVLAEEEHLHRRYGEEYEQYCRQAPRYLGFRKNC